MAKIRLTPGNMGVVGLAMDLFGAGRVNPGSWATPIWVDDVTEEEIEAARELLTPNGITVTVERN